MALGTLKRRAVSLYPTSHHLALLETRSSTLPPIPLVHLQLPRPDFDAQTTSYFLRRLNPASCAIATTSDLIHVPTSHFISQANFHSCTSTWTRLRKVVCAGPASVPILTETGLFAFSETLARCWPLHTERIRLVTMLSDGSQEEVELLGVDGEIQTWMDVLSREVLEDWVGRLDCTLQAQVYRKRKNRSGKRSGLSTKLDSAEEMRVD